jgi:hypothetical protein
LEIKLKELIPGYTDGVTQEPIPGYTDGVAQKNSRSSGDLPEGQSREEELDRRSSGEGAIGNALTCESWGVFQNHALKHGHTPACTRKITHEEQNSQSLTGAPAFKPGTDPGKAKILIESENSTWVSRLS